MRVKSAWMPLGLSLGLWAGTGQAEPQGNVALTVGVAGRGSEAVWQETKLHLGARGDILFGREENLDFGYGPYGEVLTSLDDVSVGAGVSGLLPVHPYLPVVVSGGAYVRNGPQAGWEPGAAAEVFWGSRSYNYHGRYVMAGGLTLQGRWGLGASQERAVIIAAHIDGEVLALPAVLLVSALRGGGAE